MQASTLHHHIMPEKFQLSTFSDEKYEIGVSGIENAHLKAIEQFDEDHQSDEEETRTEKMLQFENVVPEASAEIVIVKTVSIMEKETSEHLKLSDEDYQSEGMCRELIRSENELEFMNGSHNISTSERSMEKLRDNSVTLVDRMDIDMSWGAQNEPTKLIGMDSEGDNLKFLEMQSPEMEGCDGNRNNLQLSISPDGMFDSKFSDFTGR